MRRQPARGRETPDPAASGADSKTTTYKKGHSIERPFLYVRLCGRYVQLGIWLRTEIRSFLSNAWKLGRSIPVSSAARVMFQLLRLSA